MEPRPTIFRLLRQLRNALYADGHIAQKILGEGVTSITEASAPKR